MVTSPMTSELASTSCKGTKEPFFSYSGGKKNKVKAEDYTCLYDKRP